MSGEQTSGKSAAQAPAWAHEAFISHASEDRVEVEELVAALEKRGVRCWLSSRNLRLAEDFSQGIIDNIARSKAVILVVSAASVASDYVRSEIKIAKDQGKKILPVRLKDVQLGPLELFVSVNHRVDLFDGAREAHYRRIADAILSDEGLAPALAARWRLPHWARPFVVPIGVAAFIIFLVAGVQMWQMHSAVERAKQLMPNLREIKDSMEKEHLRNLQESGVDTGPSIEFNDWGRNGVQLKISRLRKAQAFYSTDGKEFVAFGRTTTFMPSAGGKFIVSLRDAAGKELERLDRSAQLAAAMKASLQENAQKRLEEPRDWGCDAYGCRFEEGSRNPVMCSAYATKITFGTSASNLTDSKNVSECTANTGQLCVSAADLSFAPRPGDTISAALTLLNGEQVRVQIPVVLSMQRRSSDLTEASKTDQWLELQALANRNPQGHAPFAAARYVPPQVIAGSFKVLFGVDPCDSEQARLLVDTDGRGLIDVGAYRGTPLVVYYSPGQGQRHIGDATITLGPDTKAIGLAVEHGGGRTTGPYWYSFDGAKVAERTGASDEVPQILCPGSGNNYIEQTFRVCRAANPLAWSKVKAVKLGPEQNSLSHEVKVQFNADEYLRFDCRVDLDRCPPFIFKIPKGWTDVFAAITMADGTTQKVSRFVLPQRQ